MRENVPTARYSPVCNVLRQWKTSLILTYRVYRLYDILYFFVSMGGPFGPAWAPRNAQRANVGPAGLGSMVNVIALKTATLVLSRG